MLFNLWEIVQANKFFKLYLIRDINNLSLGKGLNENSFDTIPN